MAKLNPGEIQRSSRVSQVRGIVSAVDGRDLTPSKRWRNRTLAVGAVGLGVGGAVVGGDAGIHALSTVLSQTHALDSVGPFADFSWRMAASAAVLVGPLTIGSLAATYGTTNAPNVGAGSAAHEGFRRATVVAGLAAGVAAIGAGVTDLAQMSGAASALADAAVGAGTVAAMTGLAALPHRRFRSRPERTLSG